MGNLSEVHIYSVWVWSTLYLLQAMGPCDPSHKWIPCISWLHTLSSLEGLERISTDFEMLSCSDVDFLHPFQCRIGDILTWTFNVILISQDHDCGGNSIFFSQLSTQEQPCCWEIPTSRNVGMPMLVYDTIRPLCSITGTVETHKLRGT